MDVADGERKKKKKKKPLETRMQYVPKKDGFASPYVAVFPSGFDPLKRSIDGEGESVCAEVAAYRNPKPMSRQQELVVRTQEDVDFVGSNFVGDAAGWQPCDYLLGVLDRVEGTLKLMPLAGEKVFRMEPRVRGLEYGRVIDEEAAEEAAEEEGDALELSRKKRRLLTEAFGSQRSKLKAARYERALVKEDDLADFKDMENLFEDAGRNEVLVASDQLDQANASIVRNIPPHDLTATTPQGAYILEKIITPGEWRALDLKELKAASLAGGFENSLNQSTVYPSFVQNRLKRLRTEGDLEGNERRAHILEYMKHLIVFHSTSPLVIKRAADPWATSSAENTVNLTEELGIPGPIVSKFLEVFTTKGVGNAKASRGCHRNKEHIELTISYALVLGLMVDDFQSDPFDLAADLRITLMQLKPHYMQLGCKFERRKAIEKKSAGEDMNSGRLLWKVTLPVPIKFPTIGSIHKQRGRS